MCRVSPYKVLLWLQLGRTSGWWDWSMTGFRVPKKKLSQIILLKFQIIKWTLNLTFKSYLIREGILNPGLVVKVWDLEICTSLGLNSSVNNFCVGPVHTKLCSDFNWVMVTDNGFGPRPDTELTIKKWGIHIINNFNQNNTHFTSKLWNINTDTTTEHMKAALTRWHR